MPISRDHRVFCGETLELRGDGLDFGEVADDLAMEAQLALTLTTQIHVHLRGYVGQQDPADFAYRGTSRLLLVERLRPMSRLAVRSE